MGNSITSPVVVGTMTFEAGGGIDLTGATLLAAAGTAGAPGVAVGEATTGIYRAGVGVLAGAAGGAQVWRAQNGAFEIPAGAVLRFAETGGNVDLNPANPAAGFTLTLPDAGGNDSLCYLGLAQTLANKTLTTPTIGSFANAAHNHSNAAGGAQLGQAAVGALADNNLGVCLTLPCSVAGSTVAVYTANAPRAFRITDVVVEATATNGSGTVKVTNGANDITNAIACDTDKAVTRAGTIDDAYSTIAAGGSLSIVVANSAAGHVVIFAQPA